MLNLLIALFLCRGRGICHVMETRPNRQGIFVFEKAVLSIINDFCNSSEQRSFIYRLKKKGLVDLIDLEGIQDNLSSDYRLNMCFSRRFPCIDGPPISPYKPLQNVHF